MVFFCLFPLTPPPPHSAYPGIARRQGHRKRREAQPSRGTGGPHNSKQWTEICDSHIRCAPKLGKHLLQEKQLEHARRFAGVGCEEAGLNP